MRAECFHTTVDAQNVYLIMLVKDFNYKNYKIRLNT